MKKYLHVKSCDSTQDLVKEQLTLHPTDQIIVSCDNQLNGHGRGQNKWHDSAGTVCFSQNINGFKIPSFTAMELAVILCHFFKKKYKNISLKWPNDLINQEEKKCGGILLQSFAHQYIAGIGINIFFPGDEFGGIFEKPFEFSKKEWAQEIGEFISENRFDNTEKLISEWRAACCHLNKPVIIQDNEIIFKGQFIGLGPHGEALLDMGDEIKSIFNGSLRLI